MSFPTSIEDEVYIAQNCTADVKVTTGKGKLHTITLSCNDAAPTAGSITVYDNTAESGTILFSVTVTTTWFAPVTITLDCLYSTGIFVGFATTGDVNCVVTYK